MRIIMLLFVLRATAIMARPQGITTKKGIIPVIEREEIRDELGQYSLRYLGGDRTMATEQGSLKPNADGTGHVLIKQGTIRYFAPDGTLISLDWVADENGFRPTGSHLPIVVVPVDGV